MTVKLLTEHHLEFLSLKEAAQACLSLHMSKCHIVGNHMSQLILLILKNHVGVPEILVAVPQILERHLCYFRRHKSRCLYTEI